jgi:hypothetical protein
MDNQGKLCERLICNRCHAKEAMFNCLMCDSFKTLCSKCDSYIHSLPSKRQHKRQPLDGSDNTKSVSMTVQPNTGGEWKIDMTIVPSKTVETSETIRDAPMMSAKSMGSTNSVGNPVFTGNTVNTVNTVNTMNTLSALVGSNGTFTKDYVNEIKVSVYIKF